MPQWDEDRQDWVTPPRAPLPPPGAGPRRPLIVAVAVLLLLGGVVFFLEQREDDHGQGASGRGATPSAAPGTSRSATTDASSTSPGALESGALPDPCAVVDAHAAAALQLSLNRSRIPSSLPPGRRMCAWTGPGSLTFTLDYSTTDVPTSPEPTPTTVRGLRSVSVSDSGMDGCTMQWPTSFGKTYVFVSSDDGSSSTLCGEAAAFAAVVAPNVPS
ncbi:DUF3558 family protein [Streptomyces sparsogenes]|uniref:DUF3558 domain-containing protein n=1 Tax=Streptomyces sparsogenes DSM 40356 TaxID=1331668 RepID=A0A1R1SEH6_9ACTN|nr:DUF3558 family protein [Streptomyces sparsogenes]OMI36811.1 hypothetical protein SPAR_23891 [Streptomyces sparsogenes DSM 40356]